jgi:hypothetical protein
MAFDGSGVVALYAVLFWCGGSWLLAAALHGIIIARSNDGAA